MPDVVLFQLSDSETRKCFRTEHIIGAKYLNIVDSFPTYETVREHAKNWEEYFCFHGLYAMTGEADGVELPLVDDGYIYRVDTTDAFPISNYQLDLAGVSQEYQGVVLNEVVKRNLQSADLSGVILSSRCDMILEHCKEKNAQIGEALFFEPFERIQEISDSYIDSFLNTLCYFYPDYVGDFFKRYFAALKLQSASYIKSKQ